MGVSGDDMGSFERNSGTRVQINHRRSVTMRIRNYITPVLAAGAAAVAIAAAPAAMADPTTAQPAAIAIAPAAVHVVPADHGGGDHGGYGGGDHGGYGRDYRGDYHGYRGGDHGGYGWGGHR
jgi:hypothetical protein